MKDLGEQLRSGKVHKFNGEQLGINTQGKGSFPRTQPTNKKWRENYDKIFSKKELDKK
jgi:hypothetical protein|tara:strand:+ start:7169 stop:7342 length:174 start_codon:yes stop_codon:yes gene_type:complete